MRRTILTLAVSWAVLQAATGVAFLKIPVDARVCAIGEAAATHSDNISAIFYNPAGLAGLRSFGAVVSHNEWLLGMNQEYAAAGFGNEELGTFGLSFNYWGSGDIQWVNFRGETIPGYYFSASDWCLNLGYGRRFGPVSVGAGFKYLAERNESLATHAFGLDAGAIYETPLTGLKAGLSVTNFGTKAKLDVEEYSLPLQGRIGWRFDWQNLGVAQDFIISETEKPGIAAGAEYRFFDMVALRAGYRTGSSTEGLSGLRAGLGVNYGGFSVDYAFAPYGELGMTHRISLSYRATSTAPEEDF